MKMRKHSKHRAFMSRKYRILCDWEQEMDAAFDRVGRAFVEMVFHWAG